MVEFNNELYFHANDGINGEELWKSDGTASGTVLVRNFDGTSKSSSPQRLRVVNGNLYFWVVNEAATNRPGLWQISQSNNQVSRIFDITHIISLVATPPNQFASILYSQSFVYNTKLYFLVNRNDIFGNNKLFLFETDGTLSGTKSVTELPATGLMQTTFFKNKVQLFFYNFLLQFDGKQIEQLARFSNDLEMRIYDVLETPNQLFFTVSSISGFNPRGEMWQTDGTVSGTQIINNNIKDGIFFQVGRVLDRKEVFFVHTDAQLGRELFALNIDTKQIRLIKDIGPKSITGVQSRTVASPEGAYIGNFFYFWAQDSFSHSLWRTDGTEQGTVPFFNHAPLVTSTGFTNLYVSNSNILYYNHYTGLSSELMAMSVNAPKPVLTFEGLSKTACYMSRLRFRVANTNFKPRFNNTYRVMMVAEPATINTLPSLVGTFNTTNIDASLNSGFGINQRYRIYVIGTSPISVTTSEVLDIRPLPTTATITYDNQLRFAPVRLEANTEAGYQWFFNSIPIMQATNKTYDALESGLYHVVVRNEFGCERTSSQISLTLQKPLSILLLPKENTMQVYPNPTTNRCIVSFETIKEENVSLKLISIKGEVIKTLMPEEKIQAGKHQIEFFVEQNCNLCMLMLNTGGQIITQKLIIH